MAQPYIVKFAEIGRWRLDPTGVFRSLGRLTCFDESAGRFRPELEEAIEAGLGESETQRRRSYPSLRIRHYCKRLLEDPHCPRSPKAKLLVYTTTAEVVLRQLDRPIVVAFRNALRKLAVLDAQQAQVILLYQVAGIVPLSIAECMECPVDAVTGDITTGQMFLQAELARAGFSLPDLEQEGIRSAREVTQLLESGLPLREIAGQRYDVLRQKARSVKRRFSHDPLYDTTEAVNDAVVRLLDKTEQRPRDEGEFLGLFIDRVRHVAVDHGRIGRRRGQGIPHVPIQDQLDSPPPGLRMNPEEELLDNELHRRVSEALKCLKRDHPEHAKILSARYYELPARNVEELASRYGVAPATIKRRIKEAVEFLREKAMA